MPEKHLYLPVWMWLPHWCWLHRVLDCKECLELFIPVSCTWSKCVVTKSLPFVGFFFCESKFISTWGDGERPLSMYTPRCCIISSTENYLKSGYWVPPLPSLYIYALLFVKELKFAMDVTPFLSWRRVLRGMRTLNQSSGCEVVLIPWLSKNSRFGSDSGCERSS